MVRTNYQKGADKERRIVNKARESGLLAFRSAGSHSPVDVCIVDMIGKTIQFVQSKGKNFPKKQVIALEEAMKELSGMYLVEFKVK